MTPAMITVAAAAGAAAGPWLRAVIFAHSVAYGRPRRAACPRCRQPVPAPWWQHRLPTSGRCPGCTRRIGPAAGLVEFCAAATFALLGWRSPNLAVFAVTAWAATFAILLSFVDSAVRRLPGRLTCPALAGVTAALTLTTAPSSRLDRLLGMAAGFVLLGGFYLTVMLIRPQAIGLGDAKWAAVLGAVLGWFGVRTALTGIAAGVVLGAVISLLLLASRRASRQHALAHGPFISLGALAAFSLHPHL